MKDGKRARSEAAPCPQDGVDHRFLSPRGIDRRVHLGKRSRDDEGFFGDCRQGENRGDTNAFLLRSEDDRADFHLGESGIRTVPIHRDGTTQIHGNVLQIAALVVAKNDGPAGKFRLGQIRPERTGVHLQKPGRNRIVPLAEDEGQAMDMTVGFRRHFPGGGVGRATKAGFRGKEGFRGADSAESAPVGKRREGQFLSAPILREGHRGKNRGFESGEGAGQLVVLNRFQDVRGVERKKKTNGKRTVKRDGTEKEGEIEPGPGPRFPGKILDRHDGRKRRRHRRGSHRWKKKTRPRHQGAGQKQTARGGHEGGGNPGPVHAILCSGPRALGEGEAD